jgi:subtilisin family serine protease
MFVVFGSGCRWIEAVASDGITYLCPMVSKFAKGVSSVRRRFWSVILVLVLTLGAGLPVGFRSSASPLVSSGQEFKPSMHVPEGVDDNHNRVDDRLDLEIAQRVLNHTDAGRVNVIVMLDGDTAVAAAATFLASGGSVTTSLWKYALYGFGGRISFGRIVAFVNSRSDVLLVEKEAECNASLAYAAQQVGVRSYVWNSLGLRGDPASSIAVFDTGIDGSHVDFAPGYGAGDFSKKIVGWNDQVNGSVTPFDDDGHGSHCSGLAAGDGFFSVDELGLATTTWSADLGGTATGSYLVSGMMVNQTGAITVSVRWANIVNGKLNGLSLYYGDKSLSSGSWTQVASVSTSNEDSLYTFSYNVASVPAGGYNMYHLVASVSRAVGSLYVMLNMSWPYMPPEDGFSAWTGIAPDSKLVGVKVLDSSGSGSSTGLVAGINWVIANRVSLHITVASMSLGFDSEISSVDVATANLVDSGVSTVVAASNDGSGANNIYSPGSVDEVLTVAAMNQFDDLAGYSSQGGTSRYTGQTVKPDVTAPGGSFYAAPLFSADTNYNDAEGRWADVVANDSAPMQGTSMAAPVVAGAAQLLVEALGGFSSWNWTRSQALLPKMLLLMTATETYPNARESGTSPTLQRGGKDAQEGYGRLNVDAAADAVLKNYTVGTTVADSLGSPPTLDDISVLGQRLAWARNVQLSSGVEYNFTLTVPDGADFDLYLYNTTGNAYGEPVILAKSATAAVGGFESVSYTPSLSGEYFIVVKRATEDTGAGEFTLASTSAASSTLFVRGSDNGIYYRTYNLTTETWAPWTRLPGATANSPAAAIVGSQLHVVVRGTDYNQLWHGVVNITDATFSGWTLLDGSTPSAPTLTANSTTLCLVVRGDNNNIYYRFYDVASSIWTSWSRVPTGSTTDTPATVLVNNALQLVVRGSDSDQLWHGTLNLGAGTFSGWTLLSGATPSSPTLAANSTSLCLVVRGNDDVAYYRWYDLASESWGGWTAVPSGATPNSAAATIVGGQMQIVVRGTEFDQIWQDMLDPSTGIWSGWMLLDGSTPSRPVLTS